MSGVKGRSGRRKNTSTLVREALDYNEAKLPEYLSKLQQLADNSAASVRERMECLFYLINRSQGNPKAQTDLRVKGQFTFTPDDYAQEALIVERERAFIAEHTPKLLKEGQNGGQNDTNGNNLPNG